MKGNFPPSLFIAANGLHWYSKKLGQLFLGLLQLLSTFMKFFGIHIGLLSTNTTYHNVVLLIGTFCKVRRHIFSSMTVMILAVYISPAGHNGFIEQNWLQYGISCPVVDCLVKREPNWPLPLLRLRAIYPYRVSIHLVGPKSLNFPRYLCVVDKSACRRMTLPTISSGVPIGSDRRHLQSKDRWSVQICWAGWCCWSWSQPAGSLHPTRLGKSSSDSHAKTGA